MRAKECRSLLHKLQNPNMEEEEEEEDPDLQEEDQDSQGSTSQKPNKTSQKNIKIPQALLSKCIQVLTNNFPTDVKEDEETEFGFACTYKNGHAHLHALLSFSRADKLVSKHLNCYSAG